MSVNQAPDLNVTLTEVIVDIKAVVFSETACGAYRLRSLEIKLAINYTTIITSGSSHYSVTCHSHTGVLSRATDTTLCYKLHG